jgi:crotonobetainyl-CoA:carnitine CoA-transferase CaiB-like acyl-CoA transferase
LTNESNSQTLDGPPGALDGLKVIELAEGITGPYCGKLVADLGAEVVKVERAGRGDPSRRIAPFYHDEPSLDSGLLFNFLNANKVGLSFDTDGSAGRKVLHGLLDDADVLLVSGRPSEIEARDLHYGVVSEKHPKLICTYVTPFGLDGARRDWKAGELVAFEMSGLGPVTPGERRGRPDLPPVKAAGSQALMAAGMTAAVATMHALFSREVSGQGQMVDVSETQPLASHQFMNVARWLYHGDPGRQGYSEGSGRIWCKDGAVFMLLFTGQEQQWKAFLELMGNPEWSKAPQFQTRAAAMSGHAAEFWAHVHEWAGQFTKEELYRNAQKLRVPLFPENSIAEAVESDQVRSRGFIQEIPLANGAIARGPIAPYAFSETPARIRRPAPTLGRDNHDVLCEHLGLSEAELANLCGAGVA